MTLAERLVSRNALLGRYAFSQLRPMACAISVGMYATVTVLAFVLGYAACSEHGHFHAADFWRSMFVTFAVLQVFILGILGMYHAGSAIQQEVVEKSMDFFRLLPLSPSRKIVGVLVGRNLVSLALGAVNTLILAVCGAVHGVQGLMLVEFIVFLWVAAGTAMLAALLAATFESRSRLTSGPLLVLVLSAFFLPYAIAMAAQWSEIFPGGAFVHFFGLRIRLFAFLIPFTLYAAFWFVLGLRRRFTNERATLFTPAGAGLCLATALLIALGLGWKYFPEAREDLIVAFWAGTAPLALLIAAGAVRSWDEYSESTGRQTVRPGLNPANLSNPTVGAGLILLWGGFALLSDVLGGNGVNPAAIPVLMSFGLVLVFLVEFSITHAPLTLRVRALAAFLAGLYGFLPLILAAVTSDSFFLVFSPFGYFSQLDRHSIAIGAPLGANAVWLIVLGALVRRRYRALPVPSDSHYGRLACKETP